jgi:hypothetical protein
MVAGGINVLTAGPAKFAGSGLTKAAFDGGSFIPDQSLKGRVNDVVNFIRKPGATPKCAYLYWGDLDKKGHGFGPDSPEWTAALTQFDSEFERLVGSLPPGTVVVLTADHGQVAVDFSQQVDVAADPTLAEGVALVGGEPRALHIYVSDTTEPGVVAQRWRDVLAGRAVVWAREEAIAAGLFGPVAVQGGAAARVRPWIGDLVVAAVGGTTIVDSRTQTADSLKLKGVHGSLTPTEMRVPLLITIT